MPRRSQHRSDQITEYDGKPTIDNVREYPGFLSLPKSQPDQALWNGNPEHVILVLDEDAQEKFSDDLCHQAILREFGQSPDADRNPSGLPPSYSYVHFRPRRYVYRDDIRVKDDVSVIIATKNGHAPVPPSEQLQNHFGERTEGMSESAWDEKYDDPRNGLVPKKWLDQSESNGPVSRRVIFGTIEPTGHCQLESNGEPGIEYRQSEVSTFRYYPTAGVHVLSKGESDVWSGQKMPRKWPPRSLAHGLIKSALKKKFWSKPSRTARKSQDFVDDWKNSQQADIARCFLDMEHELTKEIEDEAADYLLTESSRVKRTPTAGTTSSNGSATSRLSGSVGSLLKKSPTLKSFRWSRGSDRKPDFIDL